MKSFNSDEWLMKIHLDPKQPFNLDFTLSCGQVFRWKKQDDWWLGIVRNQAFKIRQLQSSLEFTNAYPDFVESYFGLKDDLGKISRKICRDIHAREAYNSFEGLRIVRQDPWECLISYICATFKNIAAIKRMLNEMAKKFGQQVTVDDYVWYSFPTADALAQAKLKDLEKCGLGYRAKYVCKTSKIVAKSGFDLERLRNESHDEARKQLLTLPGVGPKVADCILLFSLGKLDAFPVDVWVERALLRHYAEHFPRALIRRLWQTKSFSTSDYSKLNSFGRSYFGEYAGYAQEYLYHWERTSE